MPTTRRQNKSATKIQAATRGRQTRRKLKSNKSSRKSSPKSSPRECPLCKENLLPDNKRKIIELLQTIDIEEAEKFGDAAANFLQKIQATANYKKKRY